jgi:Ran GTPase-activating protein (RanGAP) involved in mRNA processing and transport
VKINLSGNSHGEKAIEWISKNIIAKSPNLKKLDFSDMFTTRSKEIVPPAIKLMLSSIVKPE